MRFVNNKTSAVLLIDLSAKFVRPLLVILAEAAARRQALPDTSAFKASPVSTQAAVMAAMAVSHEKTTMAALCAQIVKEITAPEMVKIIDVYDRQYHELASGNYGIKPVKVPEIVYRLFSNYIYEQLFDNRDVWDALGAERMTRDRFHENFRRDNDYPSSCPYCDLDTINSRGNYVIEHFLPRVRFPLLAVHPNNLFTACNSCNLAVEGKGTRIVDMVTTPYVDEIGNLVIFTFDHAAMKIAINHPSERQDVGGFLDLLQLRERYGKTNTWRQFRGRTDAFVEAVSGRNLSVSELLDYARSFNRGTVLTYALLRWVSKVYI